MVHTARILWADDEIDLLRPHILFLESKGYAVTSVTNGSDAVALVREDRFDVIFLDEQMPGMGGLAALAEIKRLDPGVPVVMVTKSDEERLMEEALGRQISDYLTKPVNPSQILLTCKRLLERSRIEHEKISQDYLQSFAALSQEMSGPLEHADWARIYDLLVSYDRRLETDEAVRQVLADQFKEANRLFSDFVQDRYADWIAASGRPPDDERPVLSHEVVGQFVLQHTGQGRPVVFFVIDCMRYDQWLEFERLLQPMFTMEREWHVSILPTATPYSRNAIFSGLLPVDLARKYPKIWADGEDDEVSRNRNEEEFLVDQLKRGRYDLRTKYQKIISSQEGRDFASSVHTYLQADLSAVVVNFVDILAHSRSDSAVLKEIAPDERAYRALTRTWFEHSWLFQAFQTLAEADCTIVITTDHGAVRALHETKVVGDRETSTALRYKYGRNLRCDDRHAIFVRDPETFGLPRANSSSNFIIAKEDYYFVYPTNYHRYVNMYRDTMQHGGASLEEMLLPVITLKPRTRGQS